MKIAVNARLLIDEKLEGVGWYTHEILRRMVEAHPEDEFLFLFDRPFDEQFLFGDNVRGYHLFPPTRHALLIAAWFQLSIPAFLKKHETDVFFSPDGFIPLRARVPSVAVIHDLAHQVFPGHIPLSDRLFYRRMLPACARKADRLLTVSEFSKNELKRLMGVSLSKIAVSYNAPRKIFKPLEEERISAIRRKYNYGRPYFLHLGAIHPRKNVVRLLRAFESYCRQGNDEVDLVLVGRKSWKTKAFEHQLGKMRHSGRVLHFRHLPEKELAGLMGSALALISVSLYEGFGMPLVEAMACDVPVIASDASAYPEIAGEAAIYVDPMDESAIVDAMARLAKNGNEREQLVLKGREQLRRYDWDESARIVYEQLTVASGQ